ncbi:putative tetratricopeptide repeat-containing domain-containing protein [Helianthus annuus]|nr:putative tetratricopeptide repeat-containing domain-containing protein [Helianthus annuus]KAJ0741539.1 putative tetratricopeptide repeat-containing domain-containing protein [Helianthus annuus]KAJ0912825.1 putative tetratricopeptide repeat-containing domain-containing protein [Helianthus annuus]
MAAPRITTPVTTNTSTPFHHSLSSPSFSTSPFPKTPHPFPTITIFTPHKLHRNTNFSTSVSGIWDAITGGADSSRQALIAIRRGMVLFRQGDVAGSVAEFDNAMKLDPRQKACELFNLRF